MADIRYAYDALGQRVVKQYQLKLRPLANTLIYGDPADPGLPGTPGGTATPSAITVYIYDSEQQLLGEYDGNTGQAQREYVWLNDTPVAMLVNDPAGLAADLLHPHRPSEHAPCGDGPQQRRALALAGRALWGQPRRRRPQRTWSVNF